MAPKKIVKNKVVKKYRIGRSSVSGRFVDKSTVKKDPEHTITESIDATEHSDRGTHEHTHEGCCGDE